jgi:hypothetical protein
MSKVVPCALSGIASNLFAVNRQGSFSVVVTHPED